jgi:hypothetical protein
MTALARGYSDKLFQLQVLILRSSLLGSATRTSTKPKCPSLYLAVLDHRDNHASP